MFDCSRLKISSDDQKAISLILICMGFLFFLIGMAAQLKASFHSRAEISTAGFVAAAIFAGSGILMFLLSFTKKRS
jgi:hypothetical protein